MKRDEIIAPVEATLLSTDPTSVEPRVLRATLRYTRTDAFAVRICFGDAGTDTSVVWVMDREMVREGLDTQVGEGDVRLWPNEHGTVLMLKLDVPGGSALISLPSQPVLAFLDATYRSVPAGRESSLLDLDTELSALLGTRQF